ncbi:hypothetical protein [Nocardia jiangxiensis]|uniref:Uncharacterized protein n=1 Tax=Nocardia jiangxiensis TaxID=282685 RepID=A0ABW6RWX3_9NOCA|nr:hypothetical protein [Nocardia jiangxiensis]
MQAQRRVVRLDQPLQDRAAEGLQRALDESAVHCRMHCPRTRANAAWP